jgi:hypothetical protein
MPPGCFENKVDSNLKIYPIIYHYLHWKIFITIYVLKILADLRDVIFSKNKFLHFGCCSNYFCVFFTTLSNSTTIHMMFNGSNAWRFQPAQKNILKANQRLFLFVELTVVEKLDISLLLNRPNTLTVNRPLLGFSSDSWALFSI